MKADNKGVGSDLKFIFWDDVGDSQEHVDNQKPSCSNHDRATEEEERLAEERMMIIIRNGNEGTHYPEYDDKEEKDNEK
jgi:hypothetical protein